MTQYKTPSYMPLRTISQRAKSWLSKSLGIGGVWFEADDMGHIVLKAQVDGKEAEGVLSLAQARALRTLLDAEIHNAEKQ